MPKQKKIHWKAPTIMLAALIAGISFATGHHLFYQSLDGTHVSTEGYSFAGLTLSRQQTNTNVGTAFAFLVRACLVVAISVAYVQVFWKAFMAGTSKKSPALGQIDTSFSALGNALVLLYAPMWRWYPLLSSLAMAAWLIPLASIITPGTLSVQVALMVPTPTSLLHVPPLNFASLSFVAGMPAVIADLHSSLEYQWGGPSQVVERIATAVGAQGAILPIVSPYPNSTWTLKFFGPSIKCEELGLSRRQQIQRNIANYTEPNCDSADAFSTWFHDLPFVSTGGSSSLSPNSAQLASTSDDNATVYVAVMPQMLNDSLAGGIPLACLAFETGPVRRSVTPTEPYTGTEEPVSDLFEGSTMLQCQLFNSTYRVTFDYVNGEQSVSIDAPYSSSDKPVTMLAAVTGPGNQVPGNPTGTCLANLREPEDNLLASNDTRCGIDSHVLQRLAYQAVMESFTNLISGTISLDNQFGLTRSSRIMTTTLVSTNELTFLGDNSVDMGSDDGGLVPYLQGALSHSEVANISGLARSDNQRANLSLQDALEETFQNITVSLMSSDLLQPNVSQAALPQTNVSSMTFRNIYVYSASKLWLAYGLAGLFSTAAVAMGLVALVSNQASYSNDFSTVVCVARNAEMSADVRKEDAEGRDPLPEYLAKATLSIRGSAHKFRQLHGDEEAVSSECGRRSRTASTGSVHSSTAALDDEEI